MKRFFHAALMTGLILGTQISANSDEPVLQYFLEGTVATDPNCVAPAVSNCPTPATVPPCVVQPQTVRRIVPRTTYQTVTRTVMVPEATTETRQVQNVEYREQARERQFTVYEQVPEAKQVTTERTVLVSENRVREETYTVQVPVTREIPESYTVNKLHTETRTGTRQIVRCVPKVEMRTVTTGGEVQKRSVNSENGGVKVQTVVVGGCKKQEAVTVMRKQIVEQTYAYDVEVSRPETRTRLTKTVEYRPETRVRTISEVVQVPKTETRTHNVTEMRSVPRQKTETYTERVPHVVTKTIQVPATRMVARQISEQVPVTVYDVVEEPISDCVQCQSTHVIGQ